LEVEDPGGNFSSGRIPGKEKVGKKSAGGKT